MTDKNGISPEKTPRIDQTAMAEALGGAAILGNSIELEDTNKKAFGFVDADKIAKNNADIYDATHPIVTTTQIVAPTKASVLDILKSDGVDDLPENKQVAPSIVIASAQRRHPEVISKTSPAFDEMYIDGIMTRVARN